eukprot:TRINITY_DN816_c0_g1_i19.p1 TRINITY_DN816_c0_g1~~TRINITY_DN816_c0_g1_i19.p1  ORF type:complete len:226 (-),score=36.07 TRINITY_DN816_c0_g1_i19:45-722(-)
MFLYPSFWWNLYKAATTPTGIVTRGKGDVMKVWECLMAHNFQEEYHKDADLFCPTCLLKKPKNTKHCATCGYCVPGYDHHCPWINKCIGEGNRYYFVCWMLILSYGLTAMMVSFWIYMSESPDLVTLYPEASQSVFSLFWSFYLVHPWYLGLFIVGILGIPFIYVTSCTQILGLAMNIAGHEWYKTRLEFYTNQELLWQTNPFSKMGVRRVIHFFKTGKVLREEF